MLYPVRLHKNGAAILTLLMALAACRPGLDQTSLLRSGPMLGYSTHREVAVWVQTRRPARIQIRYWPDTKPGYASTTPAHGTTAAGDHVALVRISDLEPGIRYVYELLINGVKVARDYPLRFQTQELWQWRSDPPRFSIAIGSCAYINEEQFDRPGAPYGGEYDIFRRILRELPDMMIWLGDNVYYREVDWTSPTQMARRYAHTRQTEDMQPLLANVHNYATWDDHDYGPDNSDWSWSLKGEALEIFERYWLNPSYGLPELPGTFGQFSWADVDFFLLDGRTYRSPSHSPENPRKGMFGPAQLDWLIDALTASRATFKVIVSGSQVLNPFAIAENYARFPEERKRLLDALEERGIDGVFFVSGDRHFTELTRQDRSGNYPLYDYTSSPLTAGTYTPGSPEDDNPQREAGTLVTDRNFGIITFSGPADDRVATLKAFDSKGEKRWSRDIRANDLKHE